LAFAFAAALATTFTAAAFSCTDYHNLPFVVICTREWRTDELDSGGSCPIRSHATHCTSMR
jgi:hypothetical protein